MRIMTWQKSQLNYKVADYWLMIKEDIDYFMIGIYPNTSDTTN